MAKTKKFLIEQGIIKKKRRKKRKVQKKWRYEELIANEEKMVEIRRGIQDWLDGKIRKKPLAKKLGIGVMLLDRVAMDYIEQREQRIMEQNLLEQGFEFPEGYKFIPPIDD